MGFAGISQPAFSRTPRTSAANRAAALGTGVQAVTARAAAGYNLTTDWALASEDPTGLATFGVGKYGKSFFAGMNADPGSATTEFWQQADTFPRMGLSYTALGAGLLMGPGNAVYDVTLTRAAPAGTSTQGLLQQNGRTFARLGFFNVKDYGATGDGTTDDRAAIQAAIDAVPSTGGVVFLPAGDYAVSTASPLTLPNDKHIGLVGAGPGIAQPGNTPCVRIKRLSGTGNVIRNSQTSSTARFSGNVRNITFYNGAGATSELALFKRTNHALWENLQFKGDGFNTPNAGTTFRGIWNSNFRNCAWHQLGNGLTSAAMYVSDDGNTAGNSNTVHWEGCEWEVNSGVDIYLDDAGGLNTAMLFFTNCKQGHNSDGVTTRTYPSVYLAHARSTVFSGCGFFLSNASASLILQPSGGNSERNSFVGCTFEHGGTPSGTIYLVDQQVGSMTVSGSVYSNYAASLTSARHIGSGVAVPSGTFNTSGFNAGGAIGGGNIYFDHTAGKKYSDARTGAPGPQMIA